MSTNTLPFTSPTLFDDLAARTRLSWLQLTAVIFVVLFLIVIGVSLLITNLAPSTRSWWRWTLELGDTPAVILYILLLLYIVRGLQTSAIQSLQPLATRDDEDFDRIVLHMNPIQHRWEWLALGLGAAVGLLLNPPWQYSGPVQPFLLFSESLRWATVIWAVYIMMGLQRQLTEVLNLDLEVNVFDPRPFEPISY